MASSSNLYKKEPISARKSPGSRQFTKHSRRIQNSDLGLKYRLFAFFPILIVLVIALKYKQSLKPESDSLLNNSQSTMSTPDVLTASQPTAEIHEKRDSATGSDPKVCIQVDENGNITDPESVKSSLGYLPGPLSHSLKVPEGSEVATFAAGCFWGVEHIFRLHFGSTSKKPSNNLDSDPNTQVTSQGGLIDAKVGYSGGYDISTLPTYKQVCTNTTNHAEVLQLSYNPALVSYSELVDFFFRIHDPTTLDQQGPDDFGTQYRSAIFTHSEEQAKIAQQIKEKYQKEWYDPVDKTVVTVVEPIKIFWDAEDYHQLYLENNQDGYKCPSHYVRTKPPKKK